MFLQRLPALLLSLLLLPHLWRQSRLHLRRFLLLLRRRLRVLLPFRRFQRHRLFLKLRPLRRFQRRRLFLKLRPLHQFPQHRLFPPSPEFLRFLLFQGPDQ